MDLQLSQGYFDASESRESNWSLNPQVKMKRLFYCKTSLTLKNYSFHSIKGMVYYRKSLTEMPHSLTIVSVVDSYTSSFRLDSLGLILA